MDQFAYECIFKESGVCYVLLWKVKFPLTFRLSELLSENFRMRSSSTENWSSVNKLRRIWVKFAGVLIQLINLLVLLGLLQHIIELC